MKHSVEVAPEVAELLQNLDAKSRRICKDNLQKLRNPYPGRGIGDKERLTVQGKDLYRLHIGRTYTAFYTIISEEKTVRVVELLPIEEAHKKYGV